ncbi:MULTISPECIES: efflux RND transporter permease subunit [unclassified Synechococcus]|uniref:efflux RND transporter permease subunit n=1 Tax=unclassified Synechococcus TaxID=2626047 RepID=UPI00006996A8|nr:MULTISPECIES: efflux RND transporter permease subunit [unclassified Synechococcus]EAQ75134.1 putative RND family multidrug efflux transporter [Synechococcus sp. WH 5701]WFN57740.1 efflux RND transporter permease subunit [Synechococcus sp. CCFWC 502]
MSLSNQFIRRPVLTAVCSLLIVIAGLISIPLLPVENLPDIAPPTVSVSANYTGADAISVEQGVTSVLEQQINGVEGMEYITSSSASDGSSAITVAFASGSDKNINQVNVQNRVGLAEPQLPEEVRQSGVSVNKASTSILLVYIFGSSDAKKPYSVETISGLLDQGLTDEIKRVTGVGDVAYFGNRQLAIRLWLNPTSLAVNGLTASDVVDSLTSQNRLVPAGQIGGSPAPADQEFTFSIELQGRLTSVEEFENLIVRRTPSGGLVRLKDVGRVTLGGESYDVSSTDLNDVPSVGMAVYQLSGSNALEVSTGVKKVLESFASTLPVGVKMEKVYDNSDFINASIEEVVGALRDAIVLVVLILFLFLQDWKATLVPTIAIPVSLIGTFAVAKLVGVSLNQLTLFGLVLATGLVVDDGIVVIEDTVSKMRSGLDALSAARAAMNELFGAILATSLVLIAVFVPVLFFPGATGTIYKQFGVTIMAAIAISTFNALTFSPMLSGLLLDRYEGSPSRANYATGGTTLAFIFGVLLSGGGVLTILAALVIGTVLGYGMGNITGRPLMLPMAIAGALTGVVIGGTEHPLTVVICTALGFLVSWFTPEIFSRFNVIYAAMEGRYHSGLDWVLGHRRLVMGLLLGGIVLTGVAFTAIPTGFVPVEDQGYALGILQAPEGTSLQNTERINRRVAEILRNEPEIATAALFSGAGFEGNTPNRGFFFFGLKPWEERRRPDQSAAAIVGRLNRQLAVIEDARMIVVEPPPIRGYGNSGGFEFQLLDRSGGALGLAKFSGAADELIGKANADDAFGVAFTQFSAVSPKLRVQVDRDRMEALDVDFGEAMQAFSVSMGGSYVNDTFQSGKVRRVYVQADQGYRSTPERLASLYVNNRVGKPIVLSEFFRVEPITGPAVIPHFNLYRAIKIEGTTAPGRSTGEVIKGMQNLFRSLQINGLGYDWTGISREEIKAGSLALAIFALGILVVYLVLAAQYESVSDPLIVLMTVPTAMLGALLFLSLRGEVLNVYAQVGLVMLIGLAAKNGILIVDLANQRLAGGLDVLESARESARSRLRPILMTAIASLLGFLPLVFSSGAGARSQISLGTVVFGGLAVATVLSLFVVPVFYVELKSWLGRQAEKSEEKKI